ncbi:PD-(D/E)XK nuclease family transposase, partial [Phocaeicola barnesiae]|uniref:PD-(D/E)XK nuclease family transposase n=1 Tax=Phocaeicola barnesiae TaxID=376804 RepID=UPI00035C7A9C
IRNLSRLMDRPVALQERVFTRLFESAEIAKFTREQYEEYEDSLKAYRDWQNTIHTAVMKSLQEGIAQGREEERLELARKFKASGIPVNIIAENTGLTEEEIADL